MRVRTLSKVRWACECVKIKVNTCSASMLEFVIFYSNVVGVSVLVSAFLVIFMFVNLVSFKEKSNFVSQRKKMITSHFESYSD